MKMVSNRSGRLLILMWILAFYILFQLCWWGYQLIQLHQEILELKSVVLGQSQLPLFQKKILMVIGEGAVFIALLIVGFWYILRIYHRELRLAGMEKTFLLSVTHELKTPVAAVKLQLETLQSSGLTDAQKDKLMNAALRETRRLQELTENILLATRLDNDQLSIHLESFALNDIVNHEVERFRFLHNNLIHVNAESDALIHGDYQMITALVSNLLDNAAKYGGAGEIQVQLKCEKNQVILKVSDSGVGIPDTEKSKIFDRFYRIGNEDTRSSKGTGLGLFICSNVVKLHHGRIHVTDNHPNGSIFVVTFPSSIK